MQDISTSEAWLHLAEQARTRKRDVLRRCGVDLLELSTGEPYEMPFVRFFREPKEIIGGYAPFPRCVTKGAKQKLHAADLFGEESVPA